jgi:hypothetical protein
MTMTLLGLAILGLAPQAQDLFVEFARASWWRIPLFLMLLAFVWAMPTHYAARLLLDTDARFQEKVGALKAQGRARCIEAMATAIPRALGLATFAAVLIAIYRSYLNLPSFSDTNDQVAVDAATWVLVWLAVLVVLVGAGFFMKRPRDADIAGLRTLKSFNRRLAPLWRRVSPGVPDRAGSDADASRDVGRFLLLGVFVVFVAIFLWGANTAAHIAPRSMAVLFILGGWLPFLSYLSGLGRQYRAPLIVGLFALIAVLAVGLGDNHSVRLIDASKTAGHAVDVNAIPLEDAVSLWMQENKCGTTELCPRPIVIAAAGGASRAAFFVGSVVGYFMQEAGDHGLDPNQVRNRIFAISGVSGGAVGAVMVTAALDATSDSTNHPCVQTPFVLWWGDSIGNWRDCFEALTSGDFLTADFFGFAFNDMLPFGLLPDRAAVLENS